MNPRTLFSLSLLGAALSAQAPSPSPALALTPQDGEGLRPVPIASGADFFGPTGVVHDRLGDTEWAAAAAWKAGFAPDGATFVPFLGSDAERNWPLTFATRRAVVAGMDLPLQQDAVAVRDGLRVTYHRGAMQERYDLRKEGMEQSFWFADLPLRGELVVEVAVQTDLECQPDGAGFRFQGPRGGVSYGTAVAIDAVGRRLDLQTEWRQGVLLLTVPADFVQQAELPLLIDPLVGTIATFATSATPLLWPDVAFDPSTGTYVTSYESVFSQTDSDVYLKRADSAFRVYASATVVDLSSASWRRPRIAGADVGDLQLVVAEASSGNVAPFKVAGRLFVDGASAATGQFDIAQNATNPDVGGDSSGQTPATFLVVYELLFSATDHDISARTVSGTGTVGAAWSVDQSAQLEREPVVSKNNGRAPGTPAWGIVYRRNLGPGIGHVRGGCWSGAGLVSNGGSRNWQLSNTSADTETSWSVSSPADTPSGRTFLAVWTEIVSIHQLGFPYKNFFDANGTVLHFPEGVQGVFGSANWIEADSDGCRFVATWSERTQWNTTEVPVVVVAWDGSTWLRHGSDRVNLGATATAADRRPAVTAAQAGPYAPRAAVVWSSLDNGTYQVQGQRYDMFHFGPGGYGWVQRVTGCGGLAIQRAGEGNINQSITVSLPGAQGLAGFVAGTAASLPIGPCPGCIQGAVGSTFIGPSLTVQIPCRVDFVGLQVSFQGWEFVNSGGACFTQIRLSDTLDLTVR